MMFQYDLPSGCALRLFEESDADELFSAVAANRAHLERWLPWVESTQSPEPILEFIRGARKQLVENNGFQAAIVDGAQIIGAVGFHAVDWDNRSTSIGYCLAENRQGRGTMTEAVRALVEYAFDAWKLNRVEIRAAVGNAKSRAIPERLGFMEEGLLREAERIGVRYEDLVVYAMLAKDWRR
jgi:ribosomal-protein-serine acetyltransferase